jgi:DNA-binding MarR family transcriptional regulator
MMETVGRSRVRIARALSVGAKTVPQLAAALDTTDGALRAAVNGMERDRQIEKVEPRVARGQRWALTEAGRRLLEQTAVEPGVLLPGQRLVVLVDQGQGVSEAAWETLAEESGSILWAARLDGNAALLVALDSREPLAADRLRSRLGTAGMSTVAGRVSETFDARELAYNRRPAISS